MSETLRQLESEMSQAVYRESAVREASFLNLPYTICGIQVRQLTPYLYMLLDFADSIFLRQKETADDALIIKHVHDFLWIVSTEFVQGDKEARTQFISKLKDIDYKETINQIYTFLDDMYIDTPPIKVKDPTKKDEPTKYNPQYYAWVGGYVDMLASEYGWTDEYILNLPIPRILQYQNIITARKKAAGGQPPAMVNRLSDPIYAKLIKLKIEEAKKQQGQING